MSKNLSKALARFEAGYNCAQSVIAGYAEDLGLEPDKALMISTGFGAGLGRKQEVCGAVTGAVMALGLRFGRGEGEEKSKTDFVYEKTRAFLDEFARAEGTVICRDLLGCDMMTEEGRAYYHENNLRGQCERYVETACRLLDRYLK